MKNSYDDIIHLPHPTSTAHARMSTASRAAQFAPFSALTGHDAAVKETARLTDRQTELEEGELANLNSKLQILADHRAERTEISIIYFRPDTKKTGGAYVRTTGIVKKVDDFEGVISLVSGEQIAFERILEVACDLFQEL